LGTWLTTITFPDDTVRYCDYSTAVQAMVGPRDSHHRYVLQEEFDLLRDDDGVRHLCEAGRSPSVCGREATGEPLGLHFPAPGMGGWTGPHRRPAWAAGLTRRRRPICSPSGTRRISAVPAS
jgi:hypothetical protein